MWIDGHPLLLFYLIGCALVVILTLVKVILYWSIDWAIKANILRKNLKNLSVHLMTALTQKAL